MPDKTNLISDREYLPKRFSLENYADAEHMNAAWWAMALSARGKIEIYIKSSNHPERCWEIDRLIEDPMFKDQQPAMSWLGSPRGPVWHLAVGHVLHFREDLIWLYKNEMAEVEKFNDDFVNDRDAVSYSDAADEIMLKPLDSVLLDSWGKYMFLAVDLTCSDQQLTRHFQELLALARASNDVTPSKQAFSKKDFARWHRYGVLPFIDLTLWAKTKNARIAQHLMGDVLFPDVSETDTTQTIRQTVKPLAKKLLQVETLSTLRAQIAKVKKG